MLLSPSASLEPLEEVIQYTFSSYTRRKLFLAGLTGYSEMVTKQEERQICAEVVRLLQSPSAAYIAEECRYCVNLYEGSDLGLAGKETLAFSLSRAPTLRELLTRCFVLGMIPEVPNLCQVNEFTGSFSGYPPHVKHANIGSYMGMLTLVSTAPMQLQHVDAPWFPRILAQPRSVFVFEAPCLHEYRMGYRATHQPFMTFRDATRFAPDYRIEVLFATVDYTQKRALHDSIRLTAASQRLQLLGDGAGGGKAAVDNGDTAERLQHAPSGQDMKPSFDVGKPRSIPSTGSASSTAKERMTKLRALHKAAIEAPKPSRSSVVLQGKRSDRR